LGYTNPSFRSFAIKYGGRIARAKAENIHSVVGFFRGKFAQRKVGIVKAVAGHGFSL
jgi:hypothetical protein